MVKKPKKIAVSGGKGGTGKSTFSILLARKIAEQGKRVILCDCDVECPNDYLLLGKDLGKPESKVYAEFPKLIKERCRKCGICVKSCHGHAIFQAPGEYPRFIKELCSGCGMCWNVCPYGAIVPEKEETGEIYVNEISKDGRFILVTGSSKPNLQETGPVVADTKKFALRLAEKNSAEVIIFDSAAGTHCPVVNAIMDADIVFAVTEPTPMGAYDLRLILELCRKMKVPAEIVLNRSDVGDKRAIEKVSVDFRVPIKKEIPYSEKLAQEYSKGDLLNIKDII